MYPIIDCHCHVYPSKIAEKAVKGIGDFYNLNMFYDGKAETLLSESQKYGIVKSFIFSVATKPEQTNSINEFIKGIIDQYPQSFVGMGALHPDSTKLDEEIEKIISLGLKGVKLHPDVQGFQLDDERCMRIFEKCEGRLPVLVHAGDKRYDNSNPDRLKKILDTFPRLTVIGAHFGAYSVWDDVSILKGYDNLYVDCSSAMAFITPRKATELVRFYSAEKVLFATDFPMWNIGDELKRFDALDLTDRERQMIFYENACNLFGLNIS